MVHQVKQSRLDFEIPIDPRLVKLTSGILATIMLTKSVNTSELAEHLPRETENVKGREMAIYRILRNDSVVPNMVMLPFAQSVIQKSADKGRQWCWQLTVSMGLPG